MTQKQKFVLLQDRAVELVLAFDTYCESDHIGFDNKDWDDIHEAADKLRILLGMPEPHYKHDASD